MALLGKQALGFICSKNKIHSLIARSDVKREFLLSFNVPFKQKLITARPVSCCIPLTCQRGTVSSPRNCMLQKNSLSETSLSCHFVRRAASTRSSVIAEITKDLDVDELRAKSDKKKGVHTATLVKETLAKRCDEALANLSDEDKKKLKVLQLEHNFLYSEGNFIPSSEDMTSENWLEAMALPSVAQRLKYYTFQMKRRQLRDKDKAKSSSTEAKKETEFPMHGYEHGRLFMRIYESTMKKWLEYGLVQAMQFGCPLVIDMDYVSFMKSQELKNTVQQLLQLYSINRADSKLPYHLHFTSCPEDHEMYKKLQIELHDSENFLATVTEKSYLDIFDRSKLVYLSPDAREVMRVFDPNLVYIIGAFNDKATQQPVSQARAKKQGIRSMRLPIDEYVQWNLGSKSITLDQMIKVMMYVKNGVPWKEAILNSVPKRKIRNEND